MRGIPFERIESSLAFGFFVNDQFEFEDLYRYLLTGNLIFSNWGIGILNQIPVVGESSEKKKEVIPGVEFVEEQEYCDGVNRKN